MSDKPAASIFAHANYRSFLAWRVEKALEEGSSYRALARAWQVKNPNYVQQLLEGRRNLTTDVARRIGKALSLSARETDYLIDLVKLENPRFKDKDRILEHMRSLAVVAGKSRRKDASIHQSWLHGVIYELATLPNMPASAAEIRQMLRNQAPEEAIAASLEFLIKKQYLIRTEDGRLQRQEIHFEPLDDIRRIDLQRSHLQFLDLAKHRLNDDLDSREFRGLTIAVPSEALPALKQEIRAFFQKLRLDLAVGDKPVDSVIRLQCCLFKLTGK